MRHTINPSYKQKESTPITTYTLEEIKLACLAHDHADVCKFGEDGLGPVSSYAGKSVYNFISGELIDRATWEDLIRG